MMTSSIRVGIAQINVALTQIDTNFIKHQQFIKEAQQDKCELLLFPELSLTGYQVAHHTPHIAMPVTDERLIRLAQIAPSMCVVVGFVEYAGPGEYYNAMAHLHHGEVKKIHRKLNLPTYGGLNEGKWFHQGQQLTHTNIKPNWHSSTLICADLWNPALVHCAFLKRPEIMLAPINSASNIVSDVFSNEKNWLTNIEFYSMTYGTPLMMANRFGPENDAHFWGGSRILNSRGEVIVQAEDKETYISCTLELNDIATARFDLPTIRDANSALIKQLLNV
ncbi:NAD+ synthetase [Marinomonas sp. 15G1-11]|uniref:NAD+ synthetase n=1 Tax=Marinomonas phaeophyticola TaxID=3004091 RepID=A0ABT4JRC9_9GAMM|nr:nitrilase-related carbon-nitrogen hydrolase [Marinomonas sp. 15G1-11]MCZ2720936.1 NAD+ synthetase [Marinomonas sp. 15G1-11]